MLLAREKKIVTLLIEHEDKLTTTQIATSLKVSSRTIKADIKKINEELEKHSCRINSQQGVGLWIEYDNHEAKKYLKEVTRDTADLYLSPEVRKYHLAVELLLQDDYISKATVLNDLNELDELWEHYGVHFIKKVKYGIKVEGNESQIRSALLEALKRAGGRQKVTVSNIQSHFTSVELKDLREIIGQMEGRFQFILTDISVGELMLDLAVMLERLSAGKTMDHEGSIPGRESRRMDFVLGYLKEHLTESFGIEIPDTEDCYLRICLSGLRFHVPMEKEQSLKEKRERNPEMFDYMMDLLMECDRKFYLQLEEDDELINALMDHLECMVLRLHSKMYTYNPILDAIKKELFYEYEIASFFMSKFTVKYGFNPTEDEIGFITSGLSISEIASVTNRPDKVMGAHFFYPAPVMKLLELVRGLVTSDETYDVVKEFAGKIGKTTVDAPEFPGFMVNRILVPMQNEAAFMVMEGSKPEDVDNAMKLGCNHPMGPIELTDFVGIDTMLATMTGLYNGFHDSKYRPCPLLETMVKSGMLGKKTGQGFYKYDEKGNKIGSNF